LDGEVAKTTDSNDANAISWLSGTDESAVDGASSTLKRGSVLRSEVVRNLVYIAFHTDV
jgi:hypothetical protein